MAEAEDERWLVAGLGNPGPAYELTWHNLGFLVIDRLAVRHSIRVTRRECQALIGSGRINRAEVILAKPQTFMNNSGESVRSVLVKNGVPPERLILVYDELDLPWTGVRVRPAGSAGGHHGVESVIKCVGGQGFPRVRLGIDPGHPVRNGAEFVLGAIPKSQRQELDELLDYASQAVESIIAEGVEKSMTKFNRRAQGSVKEAR
jgi:PTH1 family peptidyl-tRNA hydrolase